MQNHLYRLQQTNRPGTVVLLMLLIIVVIGALFWFKGPFAMPDRNRDPNLPWNEEYRLLNPNQDIVSDPSPQQPHIRGLLVFKAAVTQEDSRRGTIAMTIHTDGRLKGTWSGEYSPQPKTNCVIMMGGFRR